MLLDGALMERALRHAMGQLGRTAPNPSVGCVIAKDGQVIGEGATGAGGRPHAEETALAQAGSAAAGATVAVTLEPCAKRSSGGASCAQLLIDADVARVLVACADPHPNASGAGVKALRSAGVAVHMGLRAAEAEAINAGFFSVVLRGRPLVAASASPTGFDGPFVADASEDLRAALRAAAAQGLTRLYVAPDGALAAALRAQSLLD